MNKVRKEQVVENYEYLMQYIWHRIVPTLGKPTVITVFERAVSLTQGSYPFLQNVRIQDDGVSLSKINDTISDYQMMTDAFESLVAHLIDLLVMLTSDILVNQLIKEIEDLH